MVIHHAYPERVMDQGKNLVRDQFYHELAPSLRDVAMAELPEREQASVSFDTLYMLAKKMEAHQSSHLHRGGQSCSDAYRDKYRKYPAPRMSCNTRREIVTPV